MKPGNQGDSTAKYHSLYLGYYYCNFPLENIAFASLPNLLGAWFWFELRIVVLTEQAAMC